MTIETECPDLLRRFVRGFLDIIVLHMLIEESLWGYRMMTILKEKYKLKVGPPIIYPLLEKMEKRELVSSYRITQENRVRKMYKITEKGRYHLTCMKQMTEGILG